MQSNEWLRYLRASYFAESAMLIAVVFIWLLDNPSVWSQRYNNVVLTYYDNHYGNIAVTVNPVTGSVNVATEGNPFLTRDRIEVMPTAIREVDKYGNVVDRREIILNSIGFTVLSRSELTQCYSIDCSEVRLEAKLIHPLQPGTLLGSLTIIVALFKKAGFVTGRVPNYVETVEIKPGTVRVAYKLIGWTPCIRGCTSEGRLVSGENMEIEMSILGKQDGRTAPLYYGSGERRKVMDFGNGLVMFTSLAWAKAFPATVQPQGLYPTGIVPIGGLLPGMNSYQNQYGALNPLDPLNQYRPVMPNSNYPNNPLNQYPNYPNNPLNQYPNYPNNPLNQYPNYPNNPLNQYYPNRGTAVNPFNLQQGNINNAFINVENWYPLDRDSYVYLTRGKDFRTVAIMRFPILGIYEFMMVDPYIFYSSSQSATASVLLCSMAVVVCRLLVSAV